MNCQKYNIQNLKADLIGNFFLSGTTCMVSDQTLLAGEDAPPIKRHPINNDSQFMCGIVSRTSKGDHPWIGLERDLSATTHTYKWIDGNPLAYASFGTHPWRDETTPADDLSKTCIRLDWGPGLLFKPDACNQTKDFLCEGTCVTALLLYFSVAI